MSTTTAINIEEIVLQPQAGLGVRETVPEGLLPDFFGRAFAELGAFIGEHGAGFAGPPFARYFGVNPAAVDVEAVFPLVEPLEGEGDMHPVDLPGGPAVQALHVGPYDQMTPVYQAIEAWMSERGKRPADAPREVYLTEPGATPDPKDWQTLVIQPIE